VQVPAPFAGTDVAALALACLVLCVASNLPGGPWWRWTCTVLAGACCLCIVLLVA
jgi:hypothetical protein